jgi:hypothetical protein
VAVNPTDEVTQLPDRLNIFKPPVPDDGEYERLLQLFLELRDMLGQSVPATILRDWEARTSRELDPHEIDLLFARPLPDIFETSTLPAERCDNLRRILLRRKGLRV